MSRTSFRFLGTGSEAEAAFRFGRSEWSLPLANKFSDWWCGQIGNPPVFISNDVLPKRLYGRIHHSGRRPNPTPWYITVDVPKHKGDSESLWRTTVHEIAHIVVTGGHGPAFNKEMRRVYDAWWGWAPSHVTFPKRGRKAKRVAVAAHPPAEAMS